MWPWKRIHDTSDFDLGTDLESTSGGGPLQTAAKGVAVLTGVSLLVYSIASTTGGRDERLGPNLCPLHASPTRQIVVLIDETDPYSADQQRALATALREHHRSLRIGERLTIVLLVPDDPRSVARVLYDRCRPKSREEADPMVENPRRLDERFKREFIEPFEQTLESLRTVQSSEASPLLEALYAMAHSPELGDPATERSIEIYSDMLQNTATLSQFQPGYQLEQLIQDQSVYLEVPTLGSATVNINRVINQHRLLQTAANEQFWRDYFRHAGVDDQHVAFRQLL